MAIDLQKIINSPYTVRFVAVLARMAPRSIGYPVCDSIGRWAAKRHGSSLTQAVRLNQWMARGASPDPRLLDEAVRETLQNNARDIYELYHSLEHPDEIWRRLCLSPLVEDLVRRPGFDSRGLVISGIHLSGFDSIILSMIHRGARPLVLTIPDPQGGRRVEYEMRRKTGMNIVPASREAFRQASEHLSRGGMLLTGIDRPVQDARLRPHFFGEPAPLPTHHVFLALRARVPVVLVAAIRQEGGRYNVLSSDPIEMETHRDHETAILANAERVLKEAEGFIRLAPQQWNVPLPVWPQLLPRVPH